PPPRPQTARTDRCPRSANPALTRPGRGPPRPAAPGRSTTPDGHASIRAAASPRCTDDPPSTARPTRPHPRGASRPHHPFHAPRGWLPARPARDLPARRRRPGLPRYPDRDRRSVTLAARHDRWLGRGTPARARAAARRRRPHGVRRCGTLAVGRWPT